MVEERETVWLGLVALNTYRWRRGRPDGARAAMGGAKQIRPSPLRLLQRPTISRLCILNLDANLRSIGPDFRHIHRITQDRQSVKFARNFRPQIISDFPNALGQ